MEYQNTGSWDAHTYDEVSRLVQYKWGQQVLEFRKWRGNEIVMDAGCGSGLLTKQIAKKVPDGKVYAIDIDSNMIKKAKSNLQFCNNVEIILSSFTDTKLPRNLDVIFSNSAIHWVKDHRDVFQSFWNILKSSSMSISNNGSSSNSNDSQLLIQCGGYGNLQKIITFVEQITQSDQFKEHFTGWNQPWYFPTIEDTSRLLKEIGYTNIKVYTNNDYVFLPNRQIYSKFVKTVVLKSYLDHLSRIKNDHMGKLKDLFLEIFLDKVERYNNKSDNCWFLDFVRLNVIAHRP